MKCIGHKENLCNQFFKSVQSRAEATRGLHLTGFLLIVFREVKHGKDHHPGSEGPQFKEYRRRDPPELSGGDYRPERLG